MTYCAGESGALVLALAAISVHMGVRYWYGVWKMLTGASLCW